MLADVQLEPGEVVEGGSTLAQQPAKMLFFGPERTLERKREELWTIVIRLLPML